MALRLALLLPVPVPYREPLLALLAERGRVEPHVLYARSHQHSWQQPRAWFPSDHPYPALTLRSFEIAWRRRPTPLLVPHGVGKALDAVEPDCVLSSEFGPLTWAAIAWARRRGRPWIVLTEVTRASERVLPSWQRRLQRLIARRADSVVAVSGQARARLLAAGVASERVAVVLQPADLASCARHARVRARAEGPLRVVSVGRLVPEKRPDLLLAAAARLGGAVAVTLVGEGPLRSELEARARAQRIGNITFAGFVAPSDLPRVFADHDVFALPSSFEPFGAVVREAAACGMPLVVSDAVGAVGDIAVPGRNAIVVPAGDAEALARVLSALAGDPGRVEALSRESLAVTAERSLERDAEELEAAVARAVSGRHARRVHRHRSAAARSSG